MAAPLIASQGCWDEFQIWRQSSGDVYGANAAGYRSFCEKLIACGTAPLTLFTIMIRWTRCKCASGLHDSLPRPLSRVCEDNSLGVPNMSFLLLGCMILVWFVNFWGWNLGAWIYSSVQRLHTMATKNYHRLWGVAAAALLLVMSDALSFQILPAVAVQIMPVCNREKSSNFSSHLPPFVEHFLPSFVQHYLPSFEQLLLLFQTWFTFGNLYITLMGRRPYGHFVIMLNKMIWEDISKFAPIYLMILAGFSQLFYISSNKQNTGTNNFRQALWVGFNATLKQVQFNEDREESNPDATSRGFRHAFVLLIVLCNFFLVSLVRSRLKMKSV